ncbi:hypothetical protein DOA20_18670 [Salmonella enterica subsp. enterica serovar Newport]|nr:hypothetical protein [Salmonella enterica subsp. enterica serovar Newport]
MMKTQKTHTGTVVVDTALGKIRKTVKLYRSEKAWVVYAGETYSPETGHRNGGTTRAGVLLLETIRCLPASGG